MKFNLKAEYQPAGDQIVAIDQLIKGIASDKKEQVLLGATGTGKTFTISNVIASINKPTLVLVHNKTLAAQLYMELKSFFPNNAVEYFISNFDYYQPEAYVPGSDTYIAKDTKMNLDIERLRNSATASLFEREDVIIVSSVAAIYGLGSPVEYKKMRVSIRINTEIPRDELLLKFVDIMYQRNDIDFSPGKFRVRGDVIEIYPVYGRNKYYRIEMFGDEIESIYECDYITGNKLTQLDHILLYPASHYISEEANRFLSIERIRAELKERVKYFEENNMLVEAQRLRQRTDYDMEMLLEVGFCSGIENYSMHIGLRESGETPYTLFDYFPEDFLIVVDESHVTLPQIRGMFNGDRARKMTLVNYGFRLPSALDNRPLFFEEFEQKIKKAIYVSATPGDYELEKVNNKVVEQIIRPTGLVDPQIEIRKTDGQIDDLFSEIMKNIENNERTLITTLTIKMSEELTDYLKKLDIKVAYLHSEVKTLERSEIINSLRIGTYDVLIGINLLREGLDLPEVSLICILDADKEGFLRSKRSLIQIIGRAARNVNGRVIMYADKVTDSMKYALDETKRRRDIQIEYNKANNIEAKTIIKSISDVNTMSKNLEHKEKSYSKVEREKMRMKLEKLMKQAAKDLDFELAISLRDQIQKLED